jgi:pimeloyl-ACP methyl ester carboxylesterase
MAAAVVNWLDAEAFEKVHLLGHSLGGKLAMWVASEFPSRLESLIVADIVPKDYPPHSQEILEAMARLDLISILSRRDAEDAMLDAIPDLGMRKFVLTNLVRGEDQQFFGKPISMASSVPCQHCPPTPWPGKHPTREKPSLSVEGNRTTSAQPTKRASSNISPIRLSRLSQKPATMSISTTSLPSFPSSVPTWMFELAPQAPQSQNPYPQFSKPFQQHHGTR